MSIEKRLNYGLNPQVYQQNETTMSQFLKNLARSMAIMIQLAVFCGCGKSASDYKSVGEFTNGYAIAAYDGPNGLQRYTIINDKYESLIEGMRSIERYSDKYWIAENGDGDFVSINTQLQVNPIPYPQILEYDRVSPNAVWAVKEDKALVLVDLSSSNELSKSYPDCKIEQVLDNGTVVLNHTRGKTPGILANNYAMVSSDGTELVPLDKFSFIGDFHNGLATFSTTGYGIPLSKANTKHSQENVVNGNGQAKWFELGNQYGRFGNRNSDPYTQGYINQDGEVVIPQQYVYAQPFDELGYAIVGGSSIPSGHFYDREYSKIDKLGNIIATNLKVIEQSDCTLTEK